MWEEEEEEEEEEDDSCDTFNEDGLAEWYGNDTCIFCGGIRRKNVCSGSIGRGYS